jgi:hypothetical protein
MNVRVLLVDDHKMMREGLMDPVQYANWPSTSRVCLSQKDTRAFTLTSSSSSSFE